AIRMDYGWVNLNTSRQESGVSTPDAEAVVDRDSFASVSYDRDSKEARFVSFEGKVSVAASDGTQRQLGQREQVVQAQKGLSQAQEVPPAPVPSQPPENLQLNLANTDRLAFAWEPVAGATRYALQVARDHLFVDTIIDRSDRTRPGATLGLRGEGTFFWRVAAVNRAGVAGAWSEPRRFRVASFGVGDAGDKEPPHLALQNPESYGTIFILGGATEPGAQVEVNGEPVAVASDGAFRKTIQLTQEGWNVVSIRARDASGNETERRQRVFVELY
ncbi:MAG TPA: hypothetical protein PK413_01485, partial [Thermoanaerobaculia bacterium]|nr:hypothetical protein [Thermoanaerobaculia bacterium]